VEIQKLVEIVEGINSLHLKAIIDTFLGYIKPVQDIVHKLAANDNKVYSAAIIALMVTAPILIIRKIILLTVKFIALTSISAIILGILFRMPTSQLIASSIVVAVGLTLISRILHK